MNAFSVLPNYVASLQENLTGNAVTIADPATGRSEAAVSGDHMLRWPGYQSSDVPGSRGGV
jgi:hypothetical protein